MNRHLLKMEEVAVHTEEAWAFLKSFHWGIEANVDACLTQLWKTSRLQTSQCLKRSCATFNFKLRLINLTCLPRLLFDSCHYIHIYISKNVPVHSRFAFDRNFPQKRGKLIQFAKKFYACRYFIFLFCFLLLLFNLTTYFVLLTKLKCVQWRIHMAVGILIFFSQ